MVVSDIYGSVHQLYVHIRLDKFLDINGDINYIYFNFAQYHYHIIYIFSAILHNTI